MNLTDPTLLREAANTAYIKGNIELSNAYTDLADALDAVEALEDDLAPHKRWKIIHGDPEDYRKFFYECYEHLGEHYPAPEVTSDYDKQVIFDAIRKPE